MTASYDLAGHEVEILLQAAETADVIAALTQSLDGALVDDKGRIRSEHVELRQQKAVFLRQLASLRIPWDDSGETAKHSPVPRRPQRRGAARGVHLVGGAEA